MANFYSILGNLHENVTDICEQDNSDIISSLPMEIASEIFRCVFIISVTYTAKELVN